MHKPYVTVCVVVHIRYDFAQVSRWFAERSDLILLLFDSYKLDISDEFKGVIESLRNYDDKVLTPHRHMHCDNKGIYLCLSLSPCLPPVIWLGALCNE